MMESRDEGTEQSTTMLLILLLVTSTRHTHNHRATVYAHNTCSLRPTWSTAYHTKYLWKHSKQQNSQKSGKMHVHVCTCQQYNILCVHTSIRDVVCVGVFDLPSQLMMGVATLLLGAAAIDRQNKKVVHPIPHTLTPSHPHCTHTLTHTPSRREGSTTSCLLVSTQLWTPNKGNQLPQLPEGNQVILFDRVSVRAFLFQTTQRCQEPATERRVS